MSCLDRSGLFRARDALRSRCLIDEGPEQVTPIEGILKCFFLVNQTTPLTPDSEPQIMN